MFNPETNKDDYKICEKHRWPKYGPSGDFRAYGSTKFEVCNNCLAVRVHFAYLVNINDKWETIEESKIVEPDFKEIK
jgi:hypothetical protein